MTEASLGERTFQMSHLQLTLHASQGRTEITSNPVILESSELELAGGIGKSIQPTLSCYSWRN